MYLNRGRVVSTLLFIPMAIILCYCEEFLVAINQDEMASRYAAMYAYANIPGMYFLC